MKRKLHEDAGVPKGILRSAEILYDSVLRVITKYSKGIGRIDNEITKTFKFKTDLIINEIIIEKVEVFLSVSPRNSNNIGFLSMGYKPSSTVDYDRFIVIHSDDPSKIDLLIDLYIPNNRPVEFSEVLDYLKSSKIEITSSFAHELMHSYDFYKKNVKSVRNLVDYQSVTNFDALGIQPIRNFFHLVYLALVIETTVKPTEVASRMQSQNINKTKFLEFLLQDKTYTEFRQMKDYTMKELFDSCLNDIEYIKGAMRHNNIDIPNNDRDVVKLILELAWINYGNYSIKVLKNTLASSFFEFMIGFDPSSEKQKYFERQIQSIYSKEKNPLEFFAKNIKILNFVGENMTKKISKLYSLANDPKYDKSDIIVKIYNRSNGKR